MKATFKFIRKIVPIFTLVFFGNTLRSQCGTNNWDVTSLNASSNTQSYDIARDASGNIYVSGTFETAATFTSTCGGGGPVNVSLFGSGPSPRSAYIAKFDCGGKLLWANFESNSLGWSEGRTLVVDPAGTYVFLAGASSGTLNFRTTGHTACTSGLAAANFGTTHYFVARFNTGNGAFVDGYGPSTITAGTSYTVNSMALKKTISGATTDYNLFLCGSAIFGGTDHNFFIHNVLLSTATGYSLPWWKNALCIGGHNNQAWDIEYNPVSDLVFFTGDFDFQMQYPVSGATCTWTKTAMVDGFIGAVNPASGNPWCIHCKELGAAAGQYGTGRAVTVDAGGDMYYTGAFTGNLLSVYQGGATFLGGAPGRYAMFVTRRNSTPSMVWRNRILPVSTGSCVGTGIAINTGSVYVSGSFEGGNLVFPGGGGTYTSPGKRMFVSTFNRSTSGLVAGNTSKSTDPNSDHLTAKVACDEDYAYTCGSYKGIFDYTTGFPPMGILTSSPLLSSQNAFIVRNGAGATNPFRLITSEDGTETIIADNDIYPNPTHSELNIQLPNSDSEIVLELRDVSGKLILTEKIINSAKVKLDLSKYDSGIYLMSIKGANINTNKKIIKE